MFQLLLFILLLASGIGALPPVSASRNAGAERQAQGRARTQQPSTAEAFTEQYRLSVDGSDDPVISTELFQDLEELSRVVDISYCVGVTGIWKPFECASRCGDFKGWELVTVSGPLHRHK